MSNNSGSSLRQQLLDGAPFRSSLLYTAVPQRAASGTTGTFTRATTSTWPNNDGNQVTGVAGEIGFPGARRVRNLLTFTEDFSNAAWTKSQLTATAGQLIETAATSVHQVFQAATKATQVGDIWIVQFEAKQEGRRYVNVAMGTPPFNSSAAMFDLQNGVVVSDTGTGNITATSDGYYLCTLITLAATTATTPNVFIQTSADGVATTYAGTNGLVAISIRKAQLEDVTAQTTQTAGEYVSVGVESAPYYHGSMVDGVKCFPTDLSGNPIPSTTMLGYQAEGARTNLCLQSNAFNDAAWTVYLTPTPTQNVVGPDGATSAWTLTDNSAVDSELIYQNITLTAATYTTSIFVGKTSGATNFPVIRMLQVSGLLAASCTIDTNNGVATVFTAAPGWTITTSSASCVSYNDDYWRVSLVFLATAAVWRFDLMAAGSLTATNAIDWDIAAQGSAVFYGAQVELGSFASSYIATTTVAVTRNADVEAVSTSGNIAAAAGSVYLEYTPTHSPSGTIAFWGTYVDASNYTAILHDATNLIFRKRIAGVNYDATIANAFTANTTYKVCGSWGASGVTVTLDGTEGTANANTTAAQIAATMQIGADGNSLQQPFASVGNVRVWQRQLSESERIATTGPLDAAYLLSSPIDSAVVIAAGAPAYSVGAMEIDSVAAGNGSVEIISNWSLT